MQIKDKNKKISPKLNLHKLPFKLEKTKVTEFGKDIAADLEHILSNINLCPALRWCLSTVKKAKVFTIIYQANEKEIPIYKEEISKKLTEYSYKTIATIVDEGVEKGFFVPLDPDYKTIRDKKIKNIRPSEEVTVSFLNWNIERISAINNLIKKYSQ